MQHGGEVDLFDCKTGDSNQKWAYDPSAGASLMHGRQNSMCLVVG